MLFEIALAILVGLLAGTITGLIPGLHINLISVFIIASLPALARFSPLTIALFITSMAITHTFVDFIPSIFLGAPEEDSFLSVLPGHEMLKQGLAHQAIILTLYGSLTALAIIIIFTPIFIKFLPLIYDQTQKIIAFILIFASLYLILREKRVALALSVFFLSGFLGYFALNLPVKEPLLPLLSGLFGSSALLISLKQKIKLPPQEISKIKETSLSRKDYTKAILASVISAPLCSFLPGIGSGHAAIIGSEIIPQDRKGFLVLLGAINTIVMGLSFITIFSISRTRTGAALAIKEILQEITLFQILAIVSTIIITGILSFLIALTISKKFAQLINKINYGKISLIILVLLALFTIIFSNPLGFIVFITSTSLGIFTILSGARRINLMGALLMPTILFYLL